MTWLWVGLACAVVLAGVWFLARLRRISSGASSFDCIVKRTSKWVDGRAVYTMGSLTWYPIASLSLHPAFVWPRDAIDITQVEHADSGMVIVTLTSPQGDFELCMELQAYAGVRSWLESAPPTSAHVE